MAVVPLRDGVSGKSRLATMLDQATRRRLVAVLAERVVAVLVATPGVDRVMVVTADPSFAARVVTTAEASAGRVGVAAEAATEEGGVAAEASAGEGAVEILDQPADRPGLNAALDVARETVRQRTPAARMLVVHADLPLLTVDDVTALLARPVAVVPDATAMPGGTVVIAGDRAGFGTNALAVDVAVPFTFRFGPASLAAHRREAAERGLEVVVVDRPGSGVDLDTTADWEQLPAEVRRALQRRTKG